jgi:hypothetical protein
VSYNNLYDLYYEYDDEEMERPIADSYFLKYEEKLSHASQELFPQGLPNAHNLKQGAAPSCGFLATTFAQVKNDPHSVKEAIRANQDGKLEVSFPGVSKTIDVAPVTDAERALFSTAEDNGTWLTTLEKAWGIHIKSSNPLAAFEQTTYPEDAIEAWTNGEAVTTRVPKNPKGYREGELPDFLRTAHRELGAGHHVVAWTRHKEVDGRHFVPGHAYTVTAIDAKEGVITLRNPWGRLEPVDEDEKPLDGRDDGMFDYPLAEFHHKFAKIARQVG